MMYPWTEVSDIYMLTIPSSAPVSSSFRSISDWTGQVKLTFENVFNTMHWSLQHQLIHTCALYGTPNDAVYFCELRTTPGWEIRRGWRGHYTVNFSKKSNWMKIVKCLFLKSFVYASFAIYTDDRSEGTVEWNHRDFTRPVQRPTFRI